MNENYDNNNFHQPVYLKSEGPSGSEVDLYTALSIFVSNLLKEVGKMQDALDSQNIDKLDTLMEKFQSQCESVFLTKISEKITPIRIAISDGNINQVRKDFDNLHSACMNMTLSRPETLSMLVEMKEKFEQSTSN